MKVNVTQTKPFKKLKVKDLEVNQFFRYSNLIYKVIYVEKDAIHTVCFNDPCILFKRTVFGTYFFNHDIALITLDWDNFEMNLEYSVDQNQ